MKNKFIVSLAFAQGLFLNSTFPLYSQSWVPVSSSTNWSVSSLYNDTVTDQLYVGGYFTVIGGIAANRIAVYDGNSWASLGQGVNDYPVSCITRFNGEIYAGGGFDSAGNIKANNVARWSGTSWNKLGNGTNGWVKTMCVYNNELYIGGTFTSVNSNTISGSLARWDGANWSPAGSGLNSSVNSLKVHNGKLYVTGAFTTAGGQPAYYIASWDGTNWSSVGSGLSSTASSMAVLNGNLYINYGTNTALWDGVYLSAISGWIKNGNALCLLSDANNLYVGGHFTTIGSNNLNYIARWNQQVWSPLGTGLGPGGVFALEFYHNELYAGGWFATAGGDSIPYIAKWGVISSITMPINKDKEGFEVFPNPFNEKTTISYRSNTKGNATVKIFHPSGQLLQIVLNKNFEEGERISFTLNEHNFSQGLYYIVLHDNDGIQLKKIIKVDRK